MWRRSKMSKKALLIAILSFLLAPVCQAGTHLIDLQPTTVDLPGIGTPTGIYSDFSGVTFVTGKRSDGGNTVSYIDTKLEHIHWTFSYGPGETRAVAIYRPDHLIAI